MRDETRERLVLPLSIPIGALAFIALIVFAMSRILLNVPEPLPTAIAFMIAFNLLVVFSLVAMRPGFGKSGFALMGLVALVPAIIGGMAAAGAISVNAEKKAKGQEAAGLAVAVTAQGIAFQQADLKIPAGKPFTMNFTNKDSGVPHNVAILKEKGSSEALFREAIVTGPATVAWKAKPIPAGSYYFQCDVHPNMSGTVTAGEGAGAGPSAGAPVKIAARSLAFDVKKFAVPAAKAFKLEFDNQDSGTPHNVSILESKGASSALFRMAPIAGPQKVTWSVPPIAAGKYFFQCDVHPTTMIGEVEAT